MRIELFPWELREKSNQLFDAKNDILSFTFFDSFIERLALKVIWKEHLYKKNLVNTWGSNLDIAWVQNNLLNFGFFAGNDSYLIWNSDKLAKHVVDFFIESRSSDSTISMTFTSTYGRAYFHEAVKKTADIKSVVIKRPTPWTWGRYIDFLAMELGVRLAASAKEYLVDAIPKNSGDVIPVLKYLREKQLANPGVPVSREDVVSIVNSTVVDKFKVVECLGSKNLKQFFYQLLLTKRDIGTLRELLMFSQSYLVKLGDTSYVEGKKKTSKFDDDILHFSKSWNEQEINDTLYDISSLEVMSKSNQKKVWEELRMRYLNQLR